jgi:hypothetical protein
MHTRPPWTALFGERIIPYIFTPLQPTSFQFIILAFTQQRGKFNSGVAHRVVAVLARVVVVWPAAAEVTAGGADILPKSVVGRGGVGFSDAEAVAECAVAVLLVGLRGLLGKWVWIAASGVVAG